jgi:hypothetical protein
VAGERARELRELVGGKGARYRAGRVGETAEVVLEAGGAALTGDYLRVRAVPGGPARAQRLHRARLRGCAADLYIDLSERPEPHATPS